MDPTDRALSRKMRNLTKLTNLLIADIKTSIATYQDLFRETLNVDYVELACKEYEKHLGMLDCLKHTSFTGWISQIWTNLLSIYLMYLISLSRFDLATQ